MNLGLVLSLAGIAIIIAGVIYFFVLPDEKEPPQPVESPGSGRGGDGPVDRPVDEPEEPVDRPTEYPDDPVDEPIDEAPVDQPVERPSPATPIAKKAFPDLDIPQRALDTLKEEGFESVEDVRAVEDLTSINGIGDSYAEDIRRAIREE